MTVSRRRIPAASALAVLAALYLGACTGSSSSACGDVTDEEFDTQSSLHIAEGTEVEFLTWPPTSGPHTTGTVLSGAQSQELSGPVQVSILEAGKVIIQYDGIADGDVERLEELASENVVVAPGSELPGPVVLTAWTTKQTCDGVDTGSHRDIIEVYALQ